MTMVRLLAPACTWLSLCAILPAAAPPAQNLDPLPKGAIARLGHARMVASWGRSLHVSPDGRWAVCDGECFDLVAGGKKPAPVHVPHDYVLHRLFVGGAYAVKGTDDYAFCRPAEKPIHFATADKEDLRAIQFDARGHVAVYADGKKGQVCLAELRKKGPIEWRVIATRGPTGQSKVIGLSSSGSHVAWWDEKKQTLAVHDVAAAKTTLIDPKLDAEREGVSLLALSADGKRVAIATYQAEVRAFDVGTGKQTKRSSFVNFGSSKDGWLTPDGKAFVLHYWDQYVVVPVEGNERPWRVSLDGGWHLDRTYLYAPLPDSKRFVTVDGDGVIRVRDLKTGKQLDPHTRFPAFAGVQALDGHRAACWTSYGKAVVWDVRDGRVLSEVDLKVTREMGQQVGDMEFSQDGKFVAAGGDEDSRRSHDVLAEAATGKVIVKLNGFTAFHPSGKTAYLWQPRREDEESRCRIYDLARREWGRDVEVPFGDNAISQDGRTAIGAESGVVRLAELASGKARWTTTLPRDKGKMLNSLCLAALSRTGHRVVVVRRRDVLALDGLTGKAFFHVQFGDDDDERERVAAVSASGRWLAVIDGSLNLYDLDAQKPDVPIPNELPVGNATGLALDADGSRLLSSHADGTCLVWDLKKVVPPPKKAAEPWELLASLEPEEAQPAIEALLKDESKAIALFAKGLTPAVEVAPARVAAWIVDLDSEDFDRRTTAERNLVAAGDQAEAALRKAASKPVSIEQKRRAERLLRRLNPKTDPTHLRQLRAVEILERIGSKEAIVVLQKLAKGAPAARLTREANESLERLKGSDDR